MFGGVEAENVYTCAEGLYIFHTGTYMYVRIAACLITSAIYVAL